MVSNNTNKYPFSGTIHSIRFYTKALTASEVANLTYDNLFPTSTESYAVTFGTAENGTFEIRKGNDIISSGTEVLNGTNLTVIATPTDGYELDAITVNGTEISGNSFTVTGPTEIEVTFKEASATVEYCTPGYDSASNDPTLFLTAITSNGAKNELNYTASTVPNSPIVLLENGITVEQGTSFTITFTGNLSNVGSAVGNQFRYKHAEIFADWNGDGEFNGSTFGADEWIAKIGDCAPNPSSGWDNGTAVNTIAQTFTVPMDANAGSSRIRIKYVDAWHVRQGNDLNSDGPCVKLNKGILYDIPVTIESISTSIDAVERNPLLVKVINRTIKCSLPFTLFSIHGHKISPESQLPSGIYIVKTEIGTRKVVVY